MVQQSWLANSHLEVVRFAGELHRRRDLHAHVCWHWVRGHSRDIGHEAADTSVKAGAQGLSASVLLCLCDTMSIPGHNTITSGRNAPSTRVPRVMLITSFGTHGSRVCASFAVGAVGANSGSTVGLCSDFPFVVQVSIFFRTVVGLPASPRFSALGALSPCRQIPGARGTADGAVSRGLNAGPSIQE